MSTTTARPIRLAPALVTAILLAGGCSGAEPAAEAPAPVPSADPGPSTVATTAPPTPTPAPADAAAAGLEPTGESICAAAEAAGLTLRGGIRPDNAIDVADTICTVRLMDGRIGMSAQVPADYGGVMGQELLETTANIFAFQAEDGVQAVEGLGQGARFLSGITTGSGLYVLVRDDFVLNVNGDFTQEEMVEIAAAVLGSS